MLPATLALIDDDAEYREYLTQFLQSNGIAARGFADSEDLLAAERPFEFDFYIVDLMLPGIDGLALLRVLRRRSRAGVLVVSGKLGSEIFEQVLGTGADMHLAKPVSFEQVLLAIKAVYRRSGQLAPQAGNWQLDEAQLRLLAPDGAAIDLSPADLHVMQCLLEAEGETVSREQLAQRLGLAADDDPNLLHATIYRLRRRIEKATPALVPLQSKSRVGYIFKAPLVRA